MEEQHRRVGRQELGLQVAWRGGREAELLGEDGTRAGERGEEREGGAEGERGREREGRLAEVRQDPLEGLVHSAGRLSAESALAEPRSRGLRSPLSLRPPALALPRLAVGTAPNTQTAPPAHARERETQSLELRPWHGPGDALSPTCASRALSRPLAPSRTWSRSSAAARSSGEHEAAQFASLRHEHTRGLGAGGGPLAVYLKGTPSIA